MCIIKQLPQRSNHERNKEPGALWCSLVLLGVVWHNTVWSGAIWCGMMQFDVVWCNTVWSGEI